jgi:Asp-tRNA(Asn)/Glu-tRNA(Gln) amidotransferase A subunit family amidase
VSTDPADEFDYGDDAAPSQSAIDIAFEQLDKLAEASEREGDEIARLELALKAAQDRKKSIDERQIPELMVRMRQTKCTTLSGFDVAVSKKIRASMPSSTDSPDKFLAALAWLRDTGNDALIKNRVNVELERGQDERADELVIRLTKEGLEAEAKKWVEPATFTKLVKELLEAGSTVPRDVISVYDQQVATVKRSKAATVRARK